MVKIISIEAIRRAQIEVAKQVFKEVYADMDWIRDRIFDGTFELKDWHDDLCDALKKTQKDYFHLQGKEHD